MAVVVLAVALSSARTTSRRRARGAAAPARSGCGGPPARPRSGAVGEQIAVLIAPACGGPRGEPRASGEQRARRVVEDVPALRERMPSWSWTAPDWLSSAAVPAAEVVRRLRVGRELGVLGALALDEEAQVRARERPRAERVMEDDRRRLDHPDAVGDLGGESGAPARSRRTVSVGESSNLPSAAYSSRISVGEMTWNRAGPSTIIRRRPWRRPKRCRRRRAPHSYPCDDSHDPAHRRNATSACQREHATCPERPA